MDVGWHLKEIAWRRRVTLELGGKSPTIVDETAQVDAAAHRVAWAKYTNNGQICLAPDYVFVHESRKEEFIQKLTKNIEKFYGMDARRSDSYARIVNDRHYQRLNGYLEDAKERGATVAYGGRTDASEDYIEPTVLTDVDPTSSPTKGRSTRLTPFRRQFSSTSVGSAW
mgnify:CR=1 FL=1